MPIDTDDLAPRPVLATPPNMELMSVADLRHYITQLEAEITRAHAMIDSKGGARAAAESVFRAP
ncbi:DUF1192 domain-containing protein [Roseospira visakhapatnamensis]|uniref:Uncharacterized small protein (DUF1192 family) n=1 Tax=Roseospira visakhapatnamensis TaxID=390880 RepID=A0A7W6WAQ3_9PROT|nr:DUF1192 domain-containing protein [Roseospira visakhapatnamensis]MBB4267425.1 uncharacterized small protein (DUF1192 family) [Roseospira visakhapatnamensis]